MKPADTMPLEYSRDSLVGPLLRLEKVEVIRDEGLLSDQARSGRWVAGLRPDLLSSRTRASAPRTP